MTEDPKWTCPHCHRELESAQFRFVASIEDGVDPDEVLKEIQEKLESIPGMVEEEGTEDMALLFTVRDPNDPGALYYIELKPTEEVHEGSTVHKVVWLDKLEKDEHPTI
jgi:hypothetical protein